MLQVIPILRMYLFYTLRTVQEAKEALNRFKMEAASEVGVNLKQGYNGDLTSKRCV